MGSYKFILSGGGTGGHIYPAIAIAQGLEKAYPNASFLFVGAKGKMEMKKVPEAGYAIKGLWISGLSRKLSVALLVFPFKLVWSLWQSFFILLRVRPDLVIGTGGYASAPLLKMAQWLGFPTLIQEQNSYAGVTNKWLSKKAKAICVAYPNMEKYFPETALVYSGNPIRAGIQHELPPKEKGLMEFNLQSNLPVLLVLGGSLGAKRINAFIASQLSYFDSQGIQLLWQCGALYYDEYKSFQSDKVQLFDFISNMPLAYAAADYVISRAGAGAVSELMLVGKPALLIPSPNVAEDHQTKNAAAVVAMGAGKMIQEADLENNFQGVFESVTKDLALQSSMGDAMQKMAKPHATDTIVKTIKKIIEKHPK